MYKGIRNSSVSDIVPLVDIVKFLNTLNSLITKKNTR